MSRNTPPLQNTVPCSPPQFIQKFLILLSGIALSACATSKLNLEKKPLSFSNFISVCSGENLDELSCEGLNLRKIEFTGELYYPEKAWTADVFPLGIKVPRHGNDELWDKMSDDDFDQKITLRISEEEKQMDRFLLLHQETVHISGKVNTECLKRQREASEKMNLLNNDSDISNDLIIMQTGFCHYHGEYIDNVVINEIKQ